MASVSGSAIVKYLGDLVISSSDLSALTITSVGSLSAALDTGAITFLKRIDEKTPTRLKETRAGVVLCPTGSALSELESYGPKIIQVADPRLAFMRVVAKFFPPPTISGVDPTAVISPSAHLHPSVAVGAFSSIGNCTIGEGSVIMNNVHIYSGVTIGKHVIIHSGTVIGADGFGFQRNKEGLLEKFPHIGGVRIGDNVEIGSNTSIDRGTLDDTVIGDGSKIDNLVHIAHNVRIGKHSLVIAHAMIAGGVVIGDGAWVAPNVAVREQLTIGNNATVGLAAVVVKDVAENTTVAGAPAVELEEFKAQLQALKKLRSSSQ